MPHYDPTDVSEEINRKVYETLSMLISRLKGGEISVLEFKTAIEAVWNVSAGLIRPDLQDILDNALNRREKHQFTNVKVFLTSIKTPLMVIWSNGTTDVIVKAADASGMREKVVKTDSSASACEKFKTVCKQMESKYGTPVFCNAEVVE